MLELTKRPDEPRGNIGEDHECVAFANARRWQVIWPQVIARAWADPAFKAALIKNPRETITRSFNYDLNADLDLTIQDAPDGTPGFNYDLFKELYLTFQNAPDGTPGYNPNAEREGDPWKGLPRMELKLYIPPSPPAEQQAIAITVYSDTGRTYPMTSG